MSGFDGKLVWPDKCYCTGVNVAPIVEMLNASPAATRPASLAQASDQPPQTFKESLLAASRASSERAPCTRLAPAPAGGRILFRRMETPHAICFPCPSCPITGSASADGAAASPAGVSKRGWSIKP